MRFRVTSNLQLSISFWGRCLICFLLMPNEIVSFAVTKSVLHPMWSTECSFKGTFASRKIKSGIQVCWRACLCYAHLNKYWMFLQSLRCQDELEYIPIEVFGDVIFVAICCCSLSANVFDHDISYREATLSWRQSLRGGNIMICTGARCFWLQTMAKYLNILAGQVPRCYCPVWEETWRWNLRRGWMIFRCGICHHLKHAVFVGVSCQSSLWISRRDPRGKHLLFSDCVVLSTCLCTRLKVADSEMYRSPRRQKMGSRILMNLGGRHADTEQADPLIVPRIEKVRALDDVEQQDLAKGLFSTLGLRCLSPSLARCLNMDVFCACCQEIWSFKCEYLTWNHRILASGSIRQRPRQRKLSRGQPISKGNLWIE